MKTRILAVVLMAFVSVSMAQKIKPLTVGDKVSDIVFNRMLNYTSKSGKLSDFKGKALIIDLWFRECGSCIAAMPHLDSLQQEFQNELQFILVTKQDEKKINEFWHENKEVGKLKFVQAVNDSIVHQYFPAIAFPHQIWISKDRIVKSINDGSKTTRKNVVKFIQNDKLEIKVKKDETNPNVLLSLEPMITSKYPESRDKIVKYSYLSVYRPEFATVTNMEYDTVSKTLRYVNQNAPYTILYHIAYAGNTSSAFDNRNRIIRKDHHNKLQIEPDFVMFSNCYNYELIVKDTSSANLKKIMIEDLDHFLGFSSKEITRRVESYIVRPNGKGNRYENPLEPNEKRFVQNQKLKKGEDLVVNKFRLKMLYRNLFYYCDKPIFFEGLMDKIVNLKVRWNTSDLKSMNKELNNFDLEIVRKKVKTKVIVLSDPH